VQQQRSKRMKANATTKNSNTSINSSASRCCCCSRELALSSSAACWSHTAASHTYVCCASIQLRCGPRCQIQRDALSLSLSLSLSCSTALKCLSSVGFMDSQSTKSRACIQQSRRPLRAEATNQEASSRELDRSHEKISNKSSFGSSDIADS